jgi:hypothetical protein
MDSGENYSSNNLLINYFKLRKISIDLVLQDINSLSIIVEIIAKPGAKKEKIAITDEGKIAVFVNDRAVEGQANKAILKRLSKGMGLSFSSLELLSGAKSKMKRVKISYSFTDHKNIDYYLDKLQKLF